MQSDRMLWENFMPLFTEHNGLWKGPTTEEVGDGVQQTFWEEESSILHPGLPAAAAVHG